MKIHRSIKGYPNLTIEELKEVSKYRQELRRQGKTEEEIESLAQEFINDISTSQEIPRPS